MLLKRIIYNCSILSMGSRLRVQIPTLDALKKKKSATQKKIEIQNNGEPIPDSGLLRTRGDCRRKQAMRMGKRICMKKKKRVCLIELL